MIKNFWFQWILTTVLAIFAGIVVAAVTHQWLFGLMAYLVAAMIKDALLLQIHIKSNNVDNND